MAFGATTKFPDLARIEAEMIAEAARRQTAAMGEATDFLKRELRGEVIEAGMGARLANTWRGQVYPKGQAAIDPAGFVWSKAPKIIDAFSRGATIRPVNGAKYLWIPTKAVPNTMGRRRRKMTSDEVDSHFNAELIIRPSRKPGVLLAFINVIAAKSGRGFRPATKGRLKQGRKEHLVHMFTLVPAARMPQRFDLERAAQAAAGVYVRAAERGA